MSFSKPAPHCPYTTLHEAYKAQQKAKQTPSTIEKPYEELTCTLNPKPQTLNPKLNPEPSNSNHLNPLSLKPVVKGTYRWGVQGI